MESCIVCLQYMQKPCSNPFQISEASGIFGCDSHLKGLQKNNRKLARKRIPFRPTKPFSTRACQQICTEDRSRSYRQPQKSPPVMLIAFIFVSFAMTPPKSDLTFTYCSERKITCQALTYFSHSILNKRHLETSYCHFDLLFLPV